MEDPFGPAQLASKEVDNTTQQVIAYHMKGARNYSSTGTLARAERQPVCLPPGGFRSLRQEERS